MPSLDVVLELFGMNWHEEEQLEMLFLRRCKLRNQATGEVLSMTRTVLTLTSMIDFDGSDG